MEARNARGDRAAPGAESSIEVEALLRRLEPRLKIEKRKLQLFSRAAEGNHPCTWVGGFDTVEQLLDAGKLKWPLKGARGWSTLRAMVEAAADHTRAHGITSARRLFDGITDDVWKLWSVDEVPVAVLGDHPLTRHIDMSGEAIHKATPSSPQGQVISFLRCHRNDLVAAIELPSMGVPLHLPPELRIRHRERHMLVFPDRVQLSDEELGPWHDVVPIRFS
ncbi:MAG TPA: hypothetical protein VK606_05310 [Verrucomicrobiae bacterium]|nr:hypothetical protein [Verrucomicrobiae bacterium]